MNELRFPAWQLGDAPAEVRLRDQGFALLSASAMERLSEVNAQQLQALTAYWGDLPTDPHLRDGGRYRFRRHASLRIDEHGGMAIVPARPHWQPLDYNALHGGYERWFAPCADGFLRSAAFQRLTLALARVFSRAAGRHQGYVEVHQFRITTADGIGRPTPEGAHRDGVDYVAVLLVERKQVRGGETRVFEADGPAGLRFTMQAPWSALLLDDARVVHETTPVQPEGESGQRDTLVLTFRHHGFLDPPRVND